MTKNSSIPWKNFKYWLMCLWCMHLSDCTRGHQQDYIIRSSRSGVPWMPVNLRHFSSLQRLRSYQLFTWKFFVQLLFLQADKFLVKISSSLLNGMFTNIAVRCENTYFLSSEILQSKVSKREFDWNYKCFRMFLLSAKITNIGSSFFKL